MEMNVNLDNRKEPFPPAPAAAEIGDAGTYVFLMWNDRGRTVAVGRLGPLRFAPGLYAYVGSALRNLPHRLARHARAEKRVKWHADHLSTRFTPVAALVVESPRRLECAVARAVATLAAESFPGFGCSDCRCASHLFRLA